jgi:hypothetical protein
VLLSLFSLLRERDFLSEQRVSIIAKCREKYVQTTGIDKNKHLFFDLIGRSYLLEDTTIFYIDGDRGKTLYHQITGAVNGFTEHSKYIKTQESFKKRGLVLLKGKFEGDGEQQSLQGYEETVKESFLFLLEQLRITILLFLNGDKNTKNRKEYQRARKEFLQTLQELCTHKNLQVSSSARVYFEKTIVEEYKLVILPVFYFKYMRRWKGKRIDAIKKLIKFFFKWLIRKVFFRGVIDDEALESIVDGMSQGVKEYKRNSKG